MGAIRLEPRRNPSADGAHTSSRMTSLYSGEITLVQVAEAFSKRSKLAKLENMENEVAA